MFFLTNLTKDISLIPQDLGIDIKELISHKIRELEGQVIGDHGYIVTIIEFERSGRGVVENETGNVNFKIIYKAITFKPIENEIVDAIPVFVNEHGFFCKIGPMQIFVSQHMMENWIYENNIWKNGDRIIEIDVPIRLQIVATRINSNEITALGKIKNTFNLEIN